MRRQEYPPIELVRQVFRYENGHLFWVRRPQEHFVSDHACNVWNARFSGKEAGCLVKGRWGINFRKSILYRHVLIWSIFNDRWPPDGHVVDHKDRNGLNDRVDNLRLATKSQDNCNRTTPHGRSGLKGAFWDSYRESWYTKIKINGIQVFLGRFATPKEAHDVYMMAAKKHFGEFACED